MTIKEENGIMSVNLGRITVAYIDSESIVKVVLSDTGEVLRRDETSKLNLGGFKAVVAKYAKMMGVEI